MTQYTYQPADAQDKPLVDATIVLEALGNWSVETQPIFERAVTERTDAELKAVLDKIVQDVPLTRAQVVSMLYGYARAPVDR